MEALMRHYKAAGFSDEVSRLAAAPRRPSTNRMYDDWWLRFARWAAGFDLLDPTAAQIASSFVYSFWYSRPVTPDCEGLQDLSRLSAYLKWQGQSGYAPDNLQYDRFFGVTET